MGRRSFYFVAIAGIALASTSYFLSNPQDVQIADKQKSEIRNQDNYPSLMQATLPLNSKNEVRTEAELPNLLNYKGQIEEFNKAVTRGKRSDLIVSLDSKIKQKDLELFLQKIDDIYVPTEKTRIELEKEMDRVGKRLSSALLEKIKKGEDVSIYLFDNSNNSLRPRHPNEVVEHVGVKGLNYVVRQLPDPDSELGAKIHHIGQEYERKSKERESTFKELRALFR